MLTILEDIAWFLCKYSCININISTKLVVGRWRNRCHKGIFQNKRLIAISMQTIPEQEETQVTKMSPMCKKDTGPHPDNEKSWVWTIFMLLIYLSKTLSETLQPPYIYTEMKIFAQRMLGSILKKKW